MDGRETRKAAYREANEAAENEGTARSINREKTSTYSSTSDGSNESASGSITEPNNSAAVNAASASIEIFANDQLQLCPRLGRHRRPVRDYRVFQRRMALTNYALRHPRHRRRH